MADISILLTNDDGIYAPGIFYLKQAVEALGSVMIVAPLAEKSAVGHAITLSDPLRVQEVERDGTFFGYGVNGTPADCVKLAVHSLCKIKPDLVISGINLGPNTATNIIYSGTVSAAAEGTIIGIPSLAVSVATFQKADYSAAVHFIKRLVPEIMQRGLPEGVLLNVNIPAVAENKIRGVRITSQGKGRYQEDFDKRTDPNQRTYYWLTGKRMILDSGLDVDDSAVMENYISITPIHYDLTNYAFLEEMKAWNLQP